MSQRKLLLMAPQRDDMIAIGRALRDVGYLVFPVRVHELGVDAMIRVQPDLVLIDAAVFPAVASDACRDVVIHTAARVVLFTRSEHAGDGAALQQVAELPYPIVEYSGDARALAALLENSAGM